MKEKLKNGIKNGLESSKVYRKNKTLFLRLFVTMRNDLRRAFSLLEGTDPHGTIEDIRENIRLRGANFWILTCGAGLASIGLDVNSAAIIIGAMLISPLMTPILGIGLGVGINDRDLLFSALRNFSIGVLVSLVVSTLYFLLTPLGQPTPELDARTSPTLLDVGVAIFGGLAGIIAGSRRDKTSAIPGVAIATALMPPLCTSGFGLATGQWNYFLGAFYLFFINSVFIALMVYFMSRILHFPFKEFQDEQSRRTTRWWVLTFVTIIALPSGRVLYDVIQDLRQRQSVDNFLESFYTTDAYEPIDWEILPRSDTTTLLKIYVVGAPVDSVLIDSSVAQMGTFGLEDIDLRVVQMSISKEEEARLSQEAAKTAMKMMEIQTSVDDQKQERIDSLTNVIETMKGDTIPIWSIYGEVRTVLPEVQSLSVAKSVQSPGDASIVPLFLFEYANNYGNGRQTMVRERLMEFLKQRTGFDTIRLRRLTD